MRFNRLRDALVLPILAVLFFAFSDFSTFAVAPSSFPASVPPIYKDSSLPVETRVNDLLSRLTLDEKITLLGGTGFTTQPIKRLDIPAFVMSDGPMGARNAGPTTAYPAGIALAASFDVENARSIGTALGRDCRARGVHILLGPAMNIYRSPLNGRNFEYLGEDPMLAGTLAAGYVEGLQAEGVSATIKHFAGNEQEFDRHNLDTIADERTLREIYLRPFQICIEQSHPWCVMTSYNPLNGVHASQDKWLITDVLKNEWHFPGLVMSDWDSCYDTLGMANGGLDLEMPTAVFYSKDKLMPLIKSGQIKESTIDDKVRRLFTAAFSMGWFDHPQKDDSIALDDRQNNATALAGARDSLTLLKNENGFLPLDRSKVKNIVLVGPCADPAVVSGGGSGATTPFHPVSILQGLIAKGGDGIKVTRIPWTPPGLGTAMTHQAPSSGTWKAEFFTNEKLEGAATVTREDKFIDFKLPRKKGPADGITHEHFSARWTGTVRVERSGTYVFSTVSDDGARVMVDGKTVIEDWAAHAAKEDSVTLELEGGRDYPVVVEYYNGLADAVMRFGWGTPQEILPSQYVETIRDADVVFACLGFNDKTGASTTYEGEGSDRSYALPKTQLELLEKTLALNPHTAVLLTTGGAVDAAGWLDKTPVLMMTWYPGSDGGTAIAEAILGDINPSGKLPFTWERQWENYPAYGNYPTKESGRVNNYREGVFIGYRREQLQEKPPLFAFGCGLSYTTFEIGQPAVPQLADGAVTVTVPVINTGPRAGAEVVQLYASPHQDDQRRINRPNIELKAYTKITVAPGELKTVTLSFPISSLAFWDDASHSWSIPSGVYTLYTGSSSTQLGPGIELKLPRPMLKPAN